MRKLAVMTLLGLLGSLGAVGCGRHGTYSATQQGVSPEAGEPAPSPPPPAQSAAAPVTPGTGATAAPGGQPPAAVSAQRAARIVVLHHSTGGNVWDGGVKKLVDEHNRRQGTSYSIEERSYPNDPYPWANYPYDYYNLWVVHSGENRDRQQATLEDLTKSFDVIVFKHCFPVSGVGPDTGRPDPKSGAKTRENYVAQYEALKRKLRSFPNHKFIVWTGAALTRQNTNPEDAARARGFFDWVKSTWDERGDNVFVWDFWQLETGGGLYLLDANAASPGDSHPNRDFAEKAARLFVQRLTDVLEGRGDSGKLTGESP